VETVIFNDPFCVAEANRGLLAIVLSL